MGKHLLIDDVRNLPGMDIICRNYSSGLGVCYYFHDIDKLYIDHDLGEEKNGYQLIVELLDNGYCPKKVQIVSSNPVGVKNISEALIDAGYTKSLNGRDFELC
jgi:hypothetical protein